jgi:hypothetical protein
MKGEMLMKKGSNAKNSPCKPNELAEGKPSAGGRPGKKTAPFLFPPAGGGKITPRFDGEDWVKRRKEAPF